MRRDRHEGGLVADPLARMLRTVPDQSLVNGRHFLEFVEPIKQAKRNGDLEGAVKMLCDIVAMFERDRAAWRATYGEDGPPDSIPPWYFEHLAIVYRKQGRHDDEIAVLQRYVELEPNYSEWARERLVKARALAARRREANSNHSRPAT